MRSSLTLALLVGVAGAAGGQDASPVRHATWPSVSADGRRIAFNSDHGDATDVYTIGEDGRNLVRLTRLPGFKTLASWTADSRRVFFSVYGDTSALYMVGADGSHLQAVGRIAGSSAHLSPDGRQLVYQSSDVGPNERLIISNVDGSEPRFLTANGFPAFNSAWSPDQRRIAFAHRDSAGTFSVWVINVDGTGLRQLSNLDENEGIAQWPSWSPDGRRIAIQVAKYDRQTPASNVAHIWVIDVANGTAKKLAPHTGYVDETPSWYPDGKRIAFQSTRSGRFEIWTMNDDGSQPRQITR